MTSVADCRPCDYRVFGNRPSQKWRSQFCMGSMILVGLVLYVNYACDVRATMPQTIFSYQAGLWNKSTCLSVYDHFITHLLSIVSLRIPHGNTSAVGMVALVWVELGTAKTMNMLKCSSMFFFIFLPYYLLYFLPLFPSIFFFPNLFSVSSLSSFLLHLLCPFPIFSRLSACLICFPKIISCFSPQLSS